MVERKDCKHPEYAVQQEDGHDVCSHCWATKWPGSRWGLPAPEMIVQLREQKIYATGDMEG